MRICNEKCFGHKFRKSIYNLAIRSDHNFNENVDITCLPCGGTPCHWRQFRSPVAKWEKLKELHNGGHGDRNHEVPEHLNSDTKVYERVGWLPTERVSCENSPACTGRLKDVLDRRELHIQEMKGIIDHFWITGVEYIEAVSSFGQLRRVRDKKNAELWQHHCILLEGSHELPDCKDRIWNSWLETNGGSFCRKDWYIPPVSSVQELITKKRMNTFYSNNFEQVMTLTVLFREWKALNFFIIITWNSL